MSYVWRVFAAFVFFATLAPAQESVDGLVSRIRRHTAARQFAERSTALIELIRKDPERALSVAFSEQAVAQVRTAKVGDPLESWEDFSLFEFSMTSNGAPARRFDSKPETAVLRLI